jgi:hypothetical protein
MTQKVPDRLKPTDIPEIAIQEIATSLGIDTAMALDLIMNLQDEVDQISEDS